MGNGVVKNRKPTFVLNTPIRDLDEYRALAGLATRLKRHGHVEMNISTLAEKNSPLLTRTKYGSQENQFAV